MRDFGMEKINMIEGDQEEKIIRAIERYNESGNSADQLKIIQIIENENLSLMTSIGKGGTVLVEKLLEETVNGHKIVEKILDNCVRNSESEGSLNNSIVIDWSNITDNDTDRRTALLHHLLRFRIEYAGRNFCPYSDLLKHPVLKTFTEIKWERSLKYFRAQAVIFTSFLLLYSIFLGVLLYKPENQENCSEFLEIGCKGFLVVELLLLLVTIFLTLSEIYQAFVLKKLYLQEMENRIFSYFLVSAYFCMIFKSTLIDPKPDNWGPTLRGIVAVGVVFSWLELIFVVGRFPGFGGCLSVMFYNIIKKLFRYMIAMIIMIIGHAMAFMIITYGHTQSEEKPVHTDSKEEEEDDEGLITFDDPFKAIVKTLTMTLGEFNLDDLLNPFKGDKTSQVFALILLVSLIILGTITLVNLFIAVTTSDMDKLRKDVHTQMLVNMASFVILLEQTLPLRCLSDISLDQKMLFCPHDVCPRSCQASEEKYHYKKDHDTLVKLREIASANRRISAPMAGME